MTSDTSIMAGKVRAIRDLIETHRHCLNEPTYTAIMAQLHDLQALSSHIDCQISQLYSYMEHGHQD